MPQPLAPGVTVPLTVQTFPSGLFVRVQNGNGISEVWHGQTVNLPVGSNTISVPPQTQGATTYYVDTWAGYHLVQTVNLQQGQPQTFTAHFTTTPNSPAYSLDIDANGFYDALTDGLLVIRYMFGLREASLINGAVGSGATRSTAPAIEAYIQSLMP